MRSSSCRGSFLLGPALAMAALAAPVGLAIASSTPSLAQTAAPSGNAGAEMPKQVALTQAKIDSLVAAQKKIQEVESKSKGGADADQLDPKVQKQVEGIITSSGFASMKDFADTMFSVGVVLSGIDPDGSEYIGTAEALKKEEAQVKADKKMSPSEKKEVLDEIQAGIKNAPKDKPLPGNIEVVKANLGKLDQSQKAD